MKTKCCFTVAVKVFLVIAITTLQVGKAYAQPANDLCANATTLTSGTTVGGTLRNGTASVGIAVNCGSASSSDVWYKFTAGSPYPVITLTAVGASLNAAGVRIQLFSGTCAGFTSLACVSGNTLTVASAVGGAGLTVGTTYYIRIYSNFAGPFTAATWGFSITESDLVPTVDYGKSYVNLTKGTSGGTVEPGDILEIRATFVVKANNAYFVSFIDNIPTNTTYIAGSLNILTNEGKIYQSYTDAADADPGSVVGSAVNINMGVGASSTGGGEILNTSKPSFYGATCIMVASFQVQVGAGVAYGTQINVGGGGFSYNNNGTALTITFPAYNIMVFKNYGICSNTVGTNAIINEFGGTFGSGGGTATAKDRYASNKVPANYTYTTFNNATGMPNDYYYGMSNNTSGGTTVATGYATANTYAKPDASNQRIFGVWDIIGDHTGAINPLLGNPATDDLNGATGGYMAVVNSSYRTDTAFLDTVYNLCPNTYYQYTAWFRNICSLCGCDSTGKGATTSGYIPTGPNDSSGVHPNLTFNINGYDYYTTGDMRYTGQWIQKGFTYLTGPTQTTMVINIRNNAPGGGGNDWAIDDIGVASCTPNMTLTPNKPDTVCQGTTDSVKFLVTSFFNNYTEWELQKSSDNGTTWVSAGTDTAGLGATGSSVPVYNSTTNQYQYYVTRYYKLNLTDTLIIYRLIVASTVANLSNASCSFITLSPKIIHAVNCMIVLPTTLVSFKGQLKNTLGNLEWVSADETPDITYTVQRSDNNGQVFTSIGAVNGQAGAGQGANYAFIDPTPVSAQTYYRVLITSGNYLKYSNQVLLSNTGIDFSIRSIVNPFTDHIAMDVTMPADGTAIITLVDMYGRAVGKVRQPVTQGLNSLSVYGLGDLATGTYALQIQFNDKVISTKMIKLSK